MDKDSGNSVNKFYLVSKGDKLYDKLCSNNAPRLQEELMPCEEDCRRKRCVDRYDSSESSDSGVAVLSCTDCSGSSTASSDITDPGSPFSTTSNHSEDSISQSTKMPPTQNTHHSPWVWNVEEGPLLGRTSEEMVPPPEVVNVKQLSPSPIIESCRSPIKKTISELPKKTSDSTLCSKTKTSKLPKKQDVHKMHQGKITEYFKTHVKPLNGFKKGITVIKNKTGTLVDQQTQFNGLKAQNIRRLPKSNSSAKRSTMLSKTKKFTPITVPRKILPAPAKSETITISNNVNNIINFPLALSTVNFTPNLTYLHTKVPKPPDNIFAPQFASITDKINAIPTTIPIINRTSCLNVIQPVHPKIAPLNSFNCVKLNATVVPIVKLNNMPSKINGSSRNDLIGGQPTDLGLLETAVPTILTAKQLKINECQPIISACPTPVNNSLTNFNALPVPNSCQSEKKKNPPEPMECKMDDVGHIREVSGISDKCKDQIVQEVNKLQREDNRIYDEKTQDNSSECFINREDTQVLENYRSTNSSSKKCSTVTRERFPSPNMCTSSSLYGLCNDSGVCSEVCSDSSSVEKPRTPESDSGVSVKDSLEISVNVIVSTESQKSPILSKPKTIRFPFKQHEIQRRDNHKPLPLSSDSGRCRWADCTAHFDTSGALLEHLQHKHVISQASRDEYTCYWSGCKVHGRTSCSRSWLERHVLAHAGTKLFRCIVDGCRQRFNSQLTLQRHVNGHFNTDGKSNDSSKKTPETSSTKLFKRNGKKIRFRRQPWSARMFDFIDSGIMEGLQHKLMNITQKRTSGSMSVSGEQISLQSQILARRIEKDGARKILIRWHPQDIVSDEWINEKDFSSVKVVEIPALNASAKDALKPTLSLGPEHPRKHRRKPMKRQT